MPSERKVFSGRTADTTPPIEFDVTLTNSKGAEKTMTFSAWGTAPANSLLTVSRMGRVTKAGEEAFDVSGLGDWFEGALVPESSERWKAMIADTEWMVEGTLLGEIFQWLQGEWADRPTVPSAT